MTDCAVYWLWDKTCSDPAKDGYVGITIDVQRRINQHRQNRRFPQGFFFSVLHRGSYEECLDWEKTLRPDDWIGWNKVRGGDVGVPPGYKFSDETVQRMSAAQKGRTVSAEHRAKLAAALTGHIQSAESKAKQSATVKGRPKSAEWRAKMSEMAKARGGFFKGTHSDEAKAKMRAKRVGRSPAKGKQWTPEQKAALAQKRRALIYPGSPMVLRQQASRDAKATAVDPSD